MTDGLIIENKSIFNYMPGQIKLRLAGCSNKVLLDSFTDTFYAIGTYQPKNELESTHLLEISKVFIDEFKYRIKKYEVAKNTKAIEELAKIMQEMLKGNKFEIQEKNEKGFVYMVNNTLRLYAVCIKSMKKLGVDKTYLKRVYQ